LNKLVIVGAGIQGCTMGLAALHRGIKPILIERDEAGSGASGNSFGVVHGGLRYLQTLNVPRWHRSRLAQQWFATRFPRHVRPLRCVMPLYAGRLRSPPLFAAARLLESGVGALLQAPPPPGKAGQLAAEEVLRLFPIPRAGLIGGATWFDLELVDARALINAMVAELRAGGAALLTGHEAERLDLSDRVRGIGIRDRKTGRRSTLAATAVIDCSGSAVGGWTQTMRQQCKPPSCATLAFNLLLDIPPPPPATAVAISPVPGKGRSFFLRAQDGMTLAGTFYRPAAGLRRPAPDAAAIADALAQLRACLPDRSISASNVQGITAGLLPDTDGSGRTLETRDRVIEPIGRGFHMLISSKLTTAPLLSEQLAARLWPRPVGQPQTRTPQHA
jgi:glycerol-3-phosphate dehydrogenase